MAKPDPNHVVFPAHAGMSPDDELLDDELEGFPRSRGDEPSYRLG